MQIRTLPHTATLARSSLSKPKLMDDAARNGTGVGPDLTASASSLMSRSGDFFRASQRSAVGVAAAAERGRATPLLRRTASRRGGNSALAASGSMEDAGGKHADTDWLSDTRATTTRPLSTDFSESKRGGGTALTRTRHPPSLSRTFVESLRLDNERLRSLAEGNFLYLRRRCVLLVLLFLHISSNHLYAFERIIASLY